MTKEPGDTKPEFIEPTIEEIMAEFPVPVCRVPLSRYLPCWVAKKQYNPDGSRYIPKNPKPHHLRNQAPPVQPKRIDMFLKSCLGIDMRGVPLYSPAVKRPRGSKGVNKISGLVVGMRREEVTRIREKSMTEARAIVKTLEKQGVEVPDSEMGQEALAFAMSLVRSNIDPTAIRLNAAKLVLEYTKQKPVTRTETKLTTCEEFLTAVLIQAQEEGEEVLTLEHNPDPVIYQEEVIAEEPAPEPLKKPRGRPRKSESNA